MDSIKKVVREESRKDLENVLQEKVSALHENGGYEVDFGNIGKRTTYALIKNSNTDEEYVGWSYVKDISFFKPVVGRLKALQQATARMKMIKSRLEEEAGKIEG